MFSTNDERSFHQLGNHSDAFCVLQYAIWNSLVSRSRAHALHRFGSGLQLRLVAAGFIGLSAGGRIIPGFICTLIALRPHKRAKQQRSYCDFLQDLLLLQRFAAFPVNIEMISRFRTHKDTLFPRFVIVLTSALASRHTKSLLRFINREQGFPQLVLQHCFSSAAATPFATGIGFWGRYEQESTSVWNSDHRRCQSRVSAATKNPIEERQKYVVTEVGKVVMTHVISPRKAQPWRQPALQVNAPVNFFRRDQIHGPANHDAGCEPEVEKPVKSYDK
jgi:hypothetical protein